MVGNEGPKTVTETVTGQDHNFYCILLKKSITIKAQKNKMCGKIINFLQNVYFSAKKNLNPLLYNFRETKILVLKQ
jgi:hypothetical protein